MKRFLPFLLLWLLVTVLALGLLGHNNRRVSQLIGKVPDAFSVPYLDDTKTEFTSTSLAGKVVVLNVFASWCEACLAEHPVIMKLAAAKKAEVVGLAWRDRPEKIKAWLVAHGDPYARVAVDEKGTATLPLALSGVPETFIFGKDGRVAYNAKMAISEEELNNVILPLIERLQHE